MRIMIDADKITEIGLPNSLNTTYKDILDKGALTLKIRIFGCISIILWMLFIKR